MVVVLSQMKFRDQLKAARECASLTQVEVADAAGVSTAAVRTWEQGVCAPVAGVQKRVLAAITRLQKTRKATK